MPCRVASLRASLVIASGSFLKTPISRTSPFRPASATAAEIVSLWTSSPTYEGEHRAPPEDCGGTPGFEAFLEAVTDPSHPEHEDATEWHQGCYGKPFDPDEIDERYAKLRIGAIAKRRAAGKTAQAKKSR